MARALTVILAALALHAQLAVATEDEHNREWCIGQVEYRLPDKARVDCLTADYAIEADWAPKWAEAVGQALYYASQTGRKPGILLLVKEGDWRYVERLFEAIQKSGQPIRVWFKEVEND